MMLPFFNEAVIFFMLLLVGVNFVAPLYNHFLKHPFFFPSHKDVPFSFGAAPIPQDRFNASG